MLAELGQILKGFWDGLRPEPILTVSEWADKHRYLSPSASSAPGLWRTDRTPYLREPMDKLSAHDPTEKIVFMKSAQIGGTEAGNNWIGYIMDNAPGPCLMVMPTDETVKRNSKTRIAPMIESTPRLRDKVGTAKSRDGDNSMFQKSFPGGVLIMTGANSAVGLRSMPIRYLMLDEVDGYPEDLDEEGSPIELAIKRTDTYAKRKIFMVSTPTVDGVSAIQREFEGTDQRRYKVACPHCGGYQFLKFERLKWEERKPETARYHCEHCDTGIEERFKTAMLAGGFWEATAPENASRAVVGYHINALYSPLGWFSWAKMAAQYEAALKSPTKMKVFVNTVLGETYKQKGESPPWENLFNRREDYKVNTITADTLFLTAGVDVQRDRIELEVVGWCQGKRSYSVDYRVLDGDTSSASSPVWNRLAAVVGEMWERSDGVMLPLRLMAVDTGYNTNEVYAFCRRFDSTRVIPVKGSDSLGVPVGPPRAVDVSQAGKKIGRVKVWHVGVSMLKSELYGWLRLERGEDGTVPAGYCHFPQYAPNYFRGLTAEQLQFRVDKRGFRKYEWVKKYDRNEPLDCRIYARAAASVAGLDRWNDEQLAQVFSATYVPKSRPAQQTEKKRRSSFWD
jgi:phage terminase large subunit GpA-like protein